MKFTSYDNVHTFRAHTYDTLMRHEAQNLILLGNVIIGCEGKDKSDWRDPAHWLMATVADGAGIRLCAVMTPPHNITLYATDNIIDPAAVSCLIDGLEGREIPGVMTDIRLAEHFAGEYTRRRGMSYSVNMKLRIHELTSVNPDTERIGRLRPMDEGDMAFFPYWLEAFYTVVHRNHDEKEMNIPQDAAHYRQRIAAGGLYVLEVGGVPVSMAGLRRDIQRVIGINCVYTPPYERRKGYASAIVAGLSQLGLDRGFEKCVLYTDLANPISNSIYQKIGYRPVCDSLEIGFSSPLPAIHPSTDV